IYVLLLSLLEGDSNEDVQRAVEKMVGLIAAAMEDLGLPGLTKLKMALVSENRIIGVNVGLGLQGEMNPSGDWEELRKSEPGSDDFSLSMLLEPMYLLMGRNFDKNQATYDFETCDEEEATGAIFASEALTDDTEGWSCLEFGEIVFLENDGNRVTKTVSTLSL
ncbi:MAG: class II glutamine amidotransferase, partial [Ornithinimicrobium sp.]